METPPPLPPHPPPSPPLPTPPPLQQPQQGTGCFAKGCLVVLIVGIFLVGGLGVGAWYFYSKAIGVFTAAQPADVRIENVADTDFRSAEQKLTHLVQATVNNQEVTTEFTVPEINALIARDASFAGAKDRARVNIANSIMTLEVSAPLDSASLPKVKGRWLNGTARFRFSYVLGQFDFEPESGQANGHVIPPEFFTGFAPSFNRAFSEGFRTGIERNAPASKMWHHIKTIGLDGDKLVIATQGL